MDDADIAGLQESGAPADLKASTAAASNDPGFVASQFLVHLCKLIAFTVLAVALIGLTIAISPVIFLSIPLGIFAFGTCVTVLAELKWVWGFGALLIKLCAVK